MALGVAAATGRHVAAFPGQRPRHRRVASLPDGIYYLLLSGAATGPHVTFRACNIPRMDAAC